MTHGPELTVGGRMLKGRDIPGGDGKGKNWDNYNRIIIEYTFLKKNMSQVT